MKTRKFKDVLYSYGQSDRTAGNCYNYAAFGLQYLSLDLRRCYWNGFNGY